MHNMNQWVPIPTPVQAVSHGAQNNNLPAHDGVIFKAVVRDATGANGGSASGVYTSDWFQNPAAKGVRLFVNISTGAATGTTTVKIQVQDPGPVTAAAWDLSGATTSALAGNTTGAVLTVLPNLTQTGANTFVQNALGSRWRVVATQALAPATFSVGADYLI